MHPDERKSFAEQLHKILNANADLQEAASVGEYEKLKIKLFKRKGWNDKFSEDFIKKQLEQLLSQVSGLNDRTDIDKLAERMIESLDSYSVEQTVYIPIFGVELDKASMRLGSVLLRNISETYIETLFKRMKKVAYQSLYRSATDRDYSLQWQRQMLEGLKGTICLEYKVVAEPKRAQQEAEVLVGYFLDILWFYVPYLYGPSQKPQMGIVGQTIKSPMLNITFSSDSTVTLSLKNVSRPNQFQLSGENIQKMRKIGIVDLTTTLALPAQERTEYDSKLLRAIHWFALAQNETDIESELLSYMICLETFFSKSPADRVTIAIAEGVAFVLGYDAASRTAIKKEVSTFYSSRSDITHGRVSTMSIDSMDSFRDLVANCIMRLGPICKL